MARIQRNFVRGRMNKSLDESLLPNGEYMSRNTEAMRKFCDEQFSDRIEHDGTNRDRHTGEPQISEKYNDVIRRLKK